MGICLIYYKYTTAHILYYFSKLQLFLSIKVAFFWSGNTYFFAQGSIKLIFSNFLIFKLFFYFKNQPTYSHILILNNNNITTKSTIFKLEEKCIPKMWVLLIKKSNFYYSCANRMKILKNCAKCVLVTFNNLKKFAFQSVFEIFSFTIFKYR